MLKTKRALAFASVLIFPVVVFSMDNPTPSPKAAVVPSRQAKHLKIPTTPGHRRFLQLPEELSEKNFFQMQCRCEIVKEDSNYCIHAALGHAIADAQLHRKFENQHKVIEIAEQTFVNLSLNLTDEKIRSQLYTAAKAAWALQLDVAHLWYRGSNVDYILRYLRDETYKVEIHLNDFRKAIKESPSNPVVKHVFFYYEGKTGWQVGVYNLIWDTKRFYIKLYDTHNSPIEPGTPLFTMSAFLLDFFEGVEKGVSRYKENEKLMHKFEAPNAHEELVQLVEIFVNFNERQKLLSEFSKFNEDTSTRAQKSDDLLEQVFSDWLTSATRSALEGGFNCTYFLDTASISLGKMFLSNRQAKVRKFLLAIYKAKLDVIDAGKFTNEIRLRLIDKLLNEMNYYGFQKWRFSPREDSEAIQIFERAKAMRK